MTLITRARALALGVDGSILARVVYAGAVLLGSLVLIFRERLLPARFFYDSIRIQSEAAGDYTAPTDDSFAAIASVYRALGLSDKPDLAAWVGFVGVVAAVVLARGRAWDRRPSILEAFLAFSAVFLGAVYLANYSKDVVVLVIAVLCLRLRSRLIYEAVFIGAMVGYGLYFREYWLLIASLYVAFRIGWRWMRNEWWLLGLVAGAMVAGAFALFFVMGVEPDYFRERVNQTRLESSDATTAIKRVIDSTGLLPGTINVLAAGLFLILPVPLLLLGSAYHAAIAILLTMLWGGFIWTVRRTVRSDELRRDNRQVRGICLILAIVVTQSLFEPDYGSALRHLTPLLSIFLACAVRSDLLAQRRDEATGLSDTDDDSRRVSMGDRTKVLVVHWGQSGAGPRLTLELSRALAARDDLDVVLSYRRDTELDSELQGLGLETLAVDTYRSKVGALLNLPRFLLNVIRLRRFISTHQVEVVVSPMFSLWQNFALPLVLAPGVRFVATIHDATEHPGDEHRLKRMCQAIELRRATRLVVFSEHVRDVLVRTNTSLPPIDVTVHGSFGREESETVGSPRRLSSDVVVIGFFGRLLAYKGLELFIQAVDRLGVDGHRVRGEIRGSGSDEYVQGLPESRHVKVRSGWVEEDATNEVVAGFDLLALPYLEASQSGVLAIAMAEGVPVVATPVAGLVEQVGLAQCGVIADHVTAESFACAVLALVSDPETYETMSSNGMAAAQGTFSWSRVASDYRATVKSALG